MQSVILTAALKAQINSKENSRDKERHLKIKTCWEKKKRKKQSQNKN